MFFVSVFYAFLQANHCTKHVYLLWYGVRNNIGEYTLASAGQDGHLVCLFSVFTFVLPKVVKVVMCV